MKTINFSKLSEPFEAHDIEWRVQQSGMKGEKPWARVLAYVENRAIMQRLDDVCGAENWRNEYKPAPDGGILCGISIRVNDSQNWRQNWVTKWDGAENTDVEAVKGGLSNSMKRAAVQWGIGRYLYNLDAAFADFTDGRGEHYIQIKDSQTKKTLYTGYWDSPALPNWALPARPASKPAPAKTNVEAVKQVMGGGEEVDPLEALQDELADLMRPKFDSAQIRAAMGKLKTIDDYKTAIEKMKGGK